MSGPSGFEPLVWQHVVEHGLEFNVFDRRLSPNRLRFMPMVGHTYRNPDGRIAMLGGVFWMGRMAEAKFSFSPTVELQDATGAPLTPRVRSRVVHITSLEVLELAHRVSPVIHARLDETIPAARRWLERLGFSPPVDGAADNVKGLWVHGVSWRGVRVDRVLHRGQRSDDSIVGDSGDQRIRQLPTGPSAEAAERRDRGAA